MGKEPEAPAGRQLRHSGCHQQSHFPAELKCTWEGGCLLSKPYLAELVKYYVSIEAQDLHHYKSSSLGKREGH